MIITSKSTTLFSEYGEPDIFYGPLNLRAGVSSQTGTLQCAVVVLLTVIPNRPSRWQYLTWEPTLLHIKTAEEASSVEGSLTVLSAY